MTLRGAAAFACVGLGACGRIAFDPLGGSSDGSVASGDGLANPWPNKPAVCAVMIDTTFGTVSPPAWTVSNTVDSASDPTAPYSGKVAQWTFPIGFQSGAPGRLEYGQPALTSPAVRELYVGVVWKFSNPWQSASSDVNHLLYVDQDNGAGGVHNTLQLRGQGPYVLDASYDAIDLAPNVANVMFTTGAWHTVELHRRASTTATSQDGLVEWWLDGTLVGRHTDVNFQQFPFLAVKLEPDWASVAAPKAEDDYVRMNRVALCIP